VSGNTYIVLIGVYLQHGLLWNCIKWNYACQYCQCSQIEGKCTLAFLCITQILRLQEMSRLVTTLGSDTCWSTSWGQQQPKLLTLLSQQIMECCKSSALWRLWNLCDYSCKGTIFISPHELQISSVKCVVYAQMKIIHINYFQGAS
jgi:hypothetical protein